MSNKDIRSRALVCDVPLWKVAEKMGIADTSLSRKLRKELPIEEKARIFAIIDEIAAERSAG